MSPPDVPTRREPVGPFGVRLVRGPSRSDVDDDVTPSAALLRNDADRRPTVLSFYNDGWGGCRPVAAQMRRWATAFPHVRFLEACVVDVGVALDFHRTYGFGANPKAKGEGGAGAGAGEAVVVNGWIPSGEHLPRGYGQLGCSGFVVADADGNFVSKRTPAYLDRGEEAFRDVEALLADLLGGGGGGGPATALPSRKRRQDRPPLRFKVGDAVEANVGTYRRGTVVRVREGENAYRIRLDGPEGIEVYAPRDVDDFVRAPRGGDGRRPALRFKVGDRVEANVGTYRPGTVVRLNEGGNAYRIRLDGPEGTEVYGPQDVDGYVRAAPPSSPKAVAEMQPPSSVGVDAMDEEHRLCADAFNDALKDPTVDKLAEVFQMLRFHFAHEEELLKRYLVTSPEDLTSPFSAYASHREDHKRMLSLAARELSRVARFAGSSGSNCQVDANGVVTAWGRPSPAADRPPPGTPVDRGVVEALVRAFHEHAETFDALYHDKIPNEAL